jgi:haloacetate dehalogenase
MRKQTGITVEERRSAKRRRCMFEGFIEFDLEVAETTIHGRRGGSGPPLLLLHGIPETHVMWHRLALDAPRAVTRLAVLDIVPTGDAFSRADKNFALGFWLWSFLAAPYDLPERLLGCDPDALLDYALDAWAEEPDAFPAEVRAEYARALRDPATIHAICEEYRAAATLDCEHDEADRGRRKISCPVLALWAHDGAVANWYDPLGVWRAWADDVQGGPIRCSGHFLAEEAPEETYRRLHAFLTAPAEL